MHRSLPVAIMALAAAGGATAQPSYDHIGLGAGLIELDDGNRDGEGLAVDGQFSIADNVYLLARYAVWDLDGGVDRDDLRLGGGLHAPVSERLDLVGELFYESRELELRGGRERDNDGLGLRGGVLGSLSDAVTVGGGVVYYDLDDDEEAGIYGEAWIDVARSVQVGGEAELGDEQDLITVGARLRF